MSLAVQFLTRSVLTIIFRNLTDGIDFSCSVLHTGGPISRVDANNTGTKDVTVKLTAPGNQPTEYSFPAGQTSAWTGITGWDAETAGYVFK
jgi:hypothetical protein